MKIQGNLLGAARPRSVLPFVLGVWLLVGVMASAAMFLMFDSAGLRDEQPGLESRLSHLQEQEQHALSAGTLPPKIELQAMERRVRALNALSGVHGLDISELFVWLEQQLLNDVRLVSLHHRAQSGETRLVAEASKAEPLASLLRKLEREPRFSEVLLAKQGSRSAQGKVEAIQFEIRIRHKT